MNNINTLFQNKPKEVLNIYFTAGYPTLDSTAEIILSLQENGVDLIEIGMPYSDPMADGPTIQDSGSVALRNGMRLDILFDQLEAIKTEIKVPLIWMGYLNQVMQFGMEEFCARASAVGISGLIIPDLPMNVFEMEYKSVMQKHGLSMSFLIAPQTSEDRVRKADQLSEGFVYMVSSAAITGAKSGISNSQIDYFKRIATMNLKTPRLIGFGISNAESYNQACAHSSGAIIGSAFIKALGEPKNLKTDIKNFITSIR